MRYSFILISLLLAGCSTDPVYMKNKETGEIVKCGPYYVGLAKDFKMEGIAHQESQCIQDYKEQGFIRIPSPH